MGQRHGCNAPATQYEPEGQRLHDSAEDKPGVAENVPAMQGVQTAEDVAPTTGEYVPGSHNWGLSSPAVGQKLPAGHGLHVLLL